MSLMTMMMMYKRQDSTWTDDGSGSDNNDNNIDSDGNINSNDGWWGYTSTGEAVRWAVVGGIVLLLFLWFVGGYLHAVHRMKKGKKLLIYHRFLVTGRTRARYGMYPAGGPGMYNPGGPMYHGQPAYVNGGGYPLQSFPPPAYNPADAPPPGYVPPNGGSKVQLDQAGVSTYAHEGSSTPYTGPQGASSEQQNPFANSTYPYPPQQVAHAGNAAEDADVPPRPAKKQGLARLNPWGKK